MIHAIRQFVAAKAVIRHNGKLLVLRGSNSDLYELPGGRIEPGEYHLDSLRREIFEETGLAVSHPILFHADEVRVQKHDEEWQIIRLIFVCDASSGNITLSNDHNDALWFEPKDYQTVPMYNDVRQVFAAYLKKYSK